MCIRDRLKVAKVENIDYKDAALLRKFISLSLIHI